MVNFNLIKTSCFLSGCILLLLGTNSTLSAQIDFPDQLSVQQYFAGSWELNQHAYSIAGFVDEYPTDLESYQLVFEPGAADSLVNVGVYRNNCLKQESEIIISADVGTGCQWLLKNFPRVLPIEWLGENRFICFEVEQDSLTLWDGFLDGSFFELKRTTGFAEQNCLVPDEFEFLQHTARNNNYSVQAKMKPLENGVLYVSHNNQSPMTTVNIAGYDNTLDELYSTFLSTHSRIFEISDTSCQVVLYNLVDYDIILPGYIEILVTPSGVSVIERIDEFLDDGWYSTPDVERDTLGHLWFSSFDEVFSYDGNEVVFNASHPSIDFLHRNASGEMYGLQLGFNGPTRISRFLLDGSLDSVLTLVEPVRDVKLLGSFNYLLLDGELREYNDDFSQLTNSWVIPVGVKSLKAIDKTEDGFVLAEGLNVFEIKENDLDTLHTVVNTDENLNSILIMPDKSVLVSGLYDFVDLAEFKYFRNIPLSYEPEYEKVEVELEEFRIAPGLKDTFDFFVNNNGDTVYQVLQPVDFDFTFRNLSIDTLRITDVQTNLAFNTFGFPLKATAKYTGLLPIGEVGTTQVSFELFPFDYSELVAGISGANFRFNTVMPELIPADVLSSTIFLDEAFPVIKLYPNPTQGLLSIGSEAPVLGVTVYDLSGSLIMQIQTERKGQFDVSSLPVGMYVLEVQLSGYKNPQLVKFSKI